MSGLAAPRRHARRLGQSAQPRHADDPEQRTDRQRREGPFPTDSIDEGWDHPDRHHRQRETQRRLNGQRGADVLGVGKLGDRGAELGAVGDHRQAPDQAKHGEQQR